MIQKDKTDNALNRDNITENVNTEQTKENLSKLGRATADTAEADMDEKAAAVLGKFKDVKTLCKAYSDLEAEFTRRSQRLKEFESGNKAEIQSDGTENPPSPKGDGKTIELSQSVKDAVISEYLKNVAEAKSVSLVVGGGGVAAPRVAPKTVKQAGRLAQEFLNR